MYADIISVRPTATTAGDFLKSVNVPVFFYLSECSTCREGNIVQFRKVNHNSFLSY